MATWSAPVRYAEVDAQGIVFNAHYLLYCDEALAAFTAARGLADFAAGVRLVTTTLTWSGPARWGDVVDIDVRCARVGATSTTLAFTITAGGRACCTAQTVYVHTDATGTPRPIEESSRAALLG